MQMEEHYCDCCGEEMSHKEVVESVLLNAMREGIATTLELQELDEGQHELEFELILDDLAHAHHILAAHVLGIEECEGVEAEND